jgi:hypothetical protein
MNRILYVSLFFISSLVFTNCASTYKSIAPKTVGFNSKVVDQDVEFSYEYGVLRMRGNKKYAKREDKKGIKVVAVRIINNTDKPLKFGENLNIYSDDRQILPLEPSLVHKQLKQGVAIYLLYGLLTATRLTTTKAVSSGNTVQQQTTDVFPIGLLIGPPIMVGNLLVAGTANQRFLKELQEYDLSGKTILPGQKVYGLISMQDFGYNPLRLKIE